MRKVLLLSAIFFLGISIYSCKKDGNLTPDFEDNIASVRFADTTMIISSTIKEDSTLTSRASFGLVGVYTDSVFGSSTASYYSQVSLIGNNRDFGDLSNLVVDSIVLVLRYDSYYGTEDQQTFEVFEVTEAFDKERAYYSNDTLSIDMMPLGSKTFTPSLDSVLVGLNNQPSQIRIKLANSFAQRLLNLSGTSVFEDNDAFQEYFKGLLIKPTALSSMNLPKGAICYFSPNSSTSGLYLYFTDNGGIIPTPVSYRFEINSDDQRFSHFSHDYSGTIIEQALNNTIADTSITFVQAMSGVKTHIKMPNLQDIIADGQKKIINQAELVIPVVEGSYIEDGIANRLVIVAADSSGLGIIIPDFFVDSDYFGGIYDETNKEYRFNITRHIHQLINNNRKDYGMILLVSGAPVNAERAILRKQGDNLQGIKLNLTYSTTE